MIWWDIDQQSMIWWLMLVGLLFVHCCSFVDRLSMVCWSMEKKSACAPFHPPWPPRCSEPRGSSKRQLCESVNSALSDPKNPTLLKNLIRSANAHIKCYCKQKLHELVITFPSFQSLGSANAMSLTCAPCHSPLPSPWCPRRSSPWNSHQSWWPPPTPRSTEA